MLNTVLLLLPIWVLLDLYFFSVLQAAISGLPKFSRKLIYGLYWGLDLLLILAILNLRISGSGVFSSYFFSLVGPILLSIIPKLVMLPALMLRDLFKLIRQEKKKQQQQNHHRRKFINQVILGAASIPFSYVGFGITKGPYNYTVKRHTLYFKDLPEAFDNYRITQLSDIHAGSLKDRKAVMRGIQLANDQKSDLLVFTGDLVNNQAAELEPLKEIFAKLQAPDGVYSILGNHDYGDYMDWKSPQDKIDNLQKLKDMQAEMGFKLLNNQHVKISRGTQHINLVGVENWGKRFHQYGDLDKATSGLTPGEFNVLLSHDPSHWEAQILGHPQHMHLTLSGHTHGMQLGIDIPGLKWSPAKYMYKQWAGIYQSGTKYINVNRGFGFLGFAGRIGIWPEITLITLKKA